ncbi:MAG TPA: M28 family peptidase [Gaiellaceae bacterium]|nr:M28 family peptidase [Gaiellaceae bacterium]
MAALPPSRQRHRARPGSVDRPVNSRMYRGTWLLVGIPLLIAAFAVSRPQPLPKPDLPPDFDGAAARVVARDFANQFPDRTPGSPTAAVAASWVADQLSQYGFQTEFDRFHGKIPGRGRVQLENVLAVRQGRSNDVIAVIAHRDNSGAGPGANDNASGTAALLELARIYAAPQVPPRPPEPQHTILFLSTDGGAFGGLGAARFAAHSPYRNRVVAAINLDSIAGEGPPHLAFGSDRPRSPSAVLVRTAFARVSEQTHVEPTRPSPLAQLVDLAFPFSLYEQAPFVDKGIAAITLTSAGDRPPPAFGDSHLNGKRLTGMGRAGQALLGSLDGGVELAEGTASYVYLGSRTVRGWAIVFVLCAALLPCLAVIVDLFARLRRRHIPLLPALRSYRSRLGFWIFAVLLFELFSILGIWKTGAARPLAPELSPGTQWPVAGLALWSCLLAGAWLFTRDRLLPRRPLGDEDALAGQIGALLALAVISLLLVAMNPYSVLFVLPSLHAWIWLPQLRRRPAALQAIVLTAGFGGPLLLLGSFAVRFDLGFDAPWYLAQLAAVGYVPFTSLIVVGAWLAVAAQLTAITAGRYTPYPRAADRPRFGPGRRLVRTALLAAQRRRTSAPERKRAVGP